MKHLPSGLFLVLDEITNFQIEFHGAHLPDGDWTTDMRQGSITGRMSAPVRSMLGRGGTGGHSTSPWSLLLPSDHLGPSAFLA